MTDVRSGWENDTTRLGDSIPTASGDAVAMRLSPPHALASHGRAHACATFAEQTNDLIFPPIFFAQNYAGADMGTLPSSKAEVPPMESPWI